MTQETFKSPSRLSVQVPSSVSVRLTVEERTQLEQAAGQQSLSRFIRARLFDCTTIEMSDDKRLSPQSRQRLLAQLLMRLGQSDELQSLSQMAEATRLGLIDASPELCATLESVHEELKALRHDLLRALDLRP